MLQNIIVDGIDRLGKSTLISGLKNKLGYFNVVHYQKPENLDFYEGRVDIYQRDSFRQMFRMLDAGRFILDRAHLGETVYSQRYRGYSGDYVFDLEREATIDGHKFANNTLLVLLTTTDFSFLVDDGLSFDFSKKQDEQEDFTRAFVRSIIRNKLVIDVSNGLGGYKDQNVILDQVVKRFNLS